MILECIMHSACCESIINLQGYDAVFPVIVIPAQIQYRLTLKVCVTYFFFFYVIHLYLEEKKYSR